MRSRSNRFDPLTTHEPNKTHGPYMITVFAVPKWKPRGRFVKKESKFPHILDVLNGKSCMKMTCGVSIVANYRRKHTGH